MTELRVRKRDDANEWWRVWPGSCEIPEGVIEEDGPYEFELVDVDSPDNTSLFVEGRSLEALRSPNNRTARWVWSPGFYSGMVRIAIGFGTGKYTRTELQIDPQIAKLTRDRYNLMVEDILEDTTALFSLGPYRTGIGRGTHHELPPIARLEYLQSKFDSISEVVRKIDENPVRILKGQEEEVSYHKARNVTGRELVKSLRSGPLLEEAREPASLPGGLGGVYPMNIQKQSVETGLDIQEHREIKSTLVAWKDWLLSVSNQLEAAADASELGSRRNHWASRCRRLSSRFGQLLHIPLFESVTDTSDSPTISSIYRRKRHYRQFFRLYSDIEQGLSSITGDSLEVPLSRTYDLYELWCFLRIARALAEDSRIESPDLSNLFMSPGQGVLSIATGSVTLEYGDNLVLDFQKDFGEYWRADDKVGSISRRMRPDIVLKQENEGAKVLVLDVKYRVEAGLNDALSSAHTYRDALVKGTPDGDVAKLVTGGFLLTPHDPDTVSDWRRAPMPDRLFDDDYRDTFSIGAASLRPGMGLDEIRDTLESLCNDANFAFPPVV